MIRYITILLTVLFFTAQSYAQTAHLNTTSFTLVDPASGNSLMLLPGSLSANQTVTLSSLPGMVVSKTAAYTALSSDRFIFASAAAAYNITLPTAANKGQLITVTKTDNTPNTITVVPATGQTIVQIGTRTALSAQGYSVTLAADGTSTWYVVAHEAADPVGAVASTQQKKQGN